MFAVFRKELKLYATHIPTLLCTVFLLGGAGVLAALLNLSTGASTISLTLRYLLYPTALLLPIPMLFALCRQQKAGTRAHVHTLPLSHVSVLLGEYFAALTVFLFTAAILALYPLLFSLFGEVNLPSAYVACLGYVLLGAALLALTQAIGSCIRRPLLRAVAVYSAIALSLLLYLLPARLALPDTLYRILSGLSMFSAFDGFLYGSFYLPGAVGLLLLIVAALTVAVLAERHRRGGLATVGRRTAAITLAACLALLSLLPTATAFLLPRSLVYFDVTGTDTYHISGASKDYLRTLDSDVNIYYLCDGGQRNAYHSLEVFLEQYEAESDRIHVRYVDTEKEPAFANAYSPVPLKQHSLIVENDSRYYAIDNASLYHYYNAELNQSFSSLYYAHCLDAADYYAQNQSVGNYSEAAVEYGTALYYYSDQTTAYFDGDALLTGAILYVNADTVPTVYVLCGEEGAFDTNLHTMLCQNGYFVKYLSDLNSIPADCDLLLLHSPAKDLDTKEDGSLRTYLANGGTLFLTTSCAVARGEMSNLYALMREYGMDTPDSKNMLCQQETSASGGEEVYSYSTVFYAAADVTAPATGGFDDTFVMLAPHAITLQETAGVTHTAWLTTTEKGSILYADETETDQNGKDIIPEETEALLAERLGTYICGAIAQREDTDATVIWLSSALSVSLSGYVYSGGGNYALLQNAFDWATQNAYTPMTVDAAPLLQQTLSLTSAQTASCSLLLSLFLPLAVAAIGGVRIYVRRKR